MTERSLGSGLTAGAADQAPQDLVVLGVHGDRRGSGVLPVGVVPQVREQFLYRLVGREAGDVLGHQMLTDRPVDETAQGLIGIEVGTATGCGDVIDRILPGRAQLGSLGGDVVLPLPDSGDRVVLRPLPGPGPQRLPGRRPCPAEGRCRSARGREACG